LRRLAHLPEVSATLLYVSARHDSQVSPCTSAPAADRGSTRKRCTSPVGAAGGSALPETTPRAAPNTKKDVHAAYYKRQPPAARVERDDYRWRSMPALGDSQTRQRLEAHAWGTNGWTDNRGGGKPLHWRASRAAYRRRAPGRVSQRQELIGGVACGARTSGEIHTRDSPLSFIIAGCPRTRVTARTGEAGTGTAAQSERGSLVADRF